MKKCIRKLIAVLCAVTLTASMGSGCLAAEGESNGEVLSKEEALNPEEPIELTLWNASTEADVFHDAWQIAIEDFEKTYPNIKITTDSFENETYKTKLKTAAAGNELPDIFFSWQGGFSKTFADAGKLLDLDPYYETYKDELPEKALGNAKFVDGSIYGTAYNTLCSLVYYNKAMLDERGLEIPSTWDEFKAVCQAFIDEGIAPITTSAKEAWVAAVIHDAIGLKSAGNEKVMSVLNGESPYNDEDLLYAAQQFRELVDMGAFVEGASAIGNLEANTLFLNGDAPIFIMLSNFSDPFTKTDHPEDFSFAPFPVINDNAEITDLIGGCSEGLWVSADTEHPDTAAYAAFEITKRLADAGYAEGVGISPWTTTPKNENAPDYQKKIEEILDSATSYCLWWNTVLEGDDAAEYESLIQQLFMGDISPEDFVAGMDAQLAS